MADFLTRLAGRTLGLVPTVQPVLAPMYAPQQQFPGAEDSQQRMPDLPDRVNHVPAPGVVTEYPQRAMRGQEQSLQERLPDELPTGAPFPKYDDKTDQPPVPAYAVSHGVYISDGFKERSTGNLVERADYSQKTPSPLVPQGDQLSISPMYAPIQATHRPDRVRDVQAASDLLTSLETEKAESAPDLVPVFRSVSLEGRSSTRSALSQEQSTTGEHNGSSDTAPTSTTSDHNGGSDAAPTSIRSSFQEQSTTSDHNGGSYQESKGIVEQAYLSPWQDSPDGHTLPHPAPIDLITSFEHQGSMKTSQMPVVVDNLSVQRLSGQKVMRPQQNINGVGELRYSSNRIDKHEAAPVPQESSAPVPTIQVTIGRIEVRATPPQKIPSRDTSTRSGPPVMGLEEYLNQRAKGGY